MDHREANAVIARRRAEACDRVARKERLLALSAQLDARDATEPGATDRMETLACLHDAAAALQAKAAAHYRELADRIETRGDSGDELCRDPEAPGESNRGDDLAARLMWAREKDYPATNARGANGWVDPPLLPSE